MTLYLITATIILLGLALFFAGLLSIAKVKLHVERDPRIDQVQDVLPAANCGACGFAGCAAFAKAVVEEQAPLDGCPVGGPQVAEAIAALLGVDVVKTYPYRPVVHCSARTEDKLGLAPYDGAISCTEADAVGVTQGCAYGCLGLSDCVASCDYDAIHVIDGLAVVDYDKCTGCGACVRACPRNIIKLIPFKEERMLVVACSNPEPGKSVKQVCKVGCIGCKACHRLFGDLFEMKDNLAHLDYEHYAGGEQLAKAIEKCPAKAMVYLGKPKPEYEERLAAKEPEPAVG